MICTCGDPTALGVVHLRTRPCFHYVEREWVGLTDEEAAECWSTSAVQTWKHIEAKLKEKNCG